MAANQNTDTQYFNEDVVYRVDKYGNVEFGIVMENDDQELSDQNFDNNAEAKRKHGEVRVLWHPSGIEESISSKKVRLADRTLMPGDVVRRMIEGKDTQRGYCRDIELTACVQVIGTKQVLKNIRSEDLASLEEFGTDIAVCMDSWVGGIRMVHFKLWLATPDGSHCVINEMDAQGLAHFEERRKNDNDFPHSSEFYPGQCLWGPIQCLEDANWITCTKEMLIKRRTKPQKKTQVIVQKVEADWVGVHWHCRGYSKDGLWSDQVQPKFLVQNENLKKLKLINIFEPLTLQVGDRNFYLLKKNDNIITREKWKKQQREYYQIPKQSPRKSRIKIIDHKIKDEKDLKIHQFDDTKKDLNTFQNNDNKTLNLPIDSNDHSDNWESDDTYSQSDTASTMSSGSSSMSSAGNKKKKRPALMTKVLKKKKLIKAKKKLPQIPLLIGDKIVVETLSTSTKATVVWQDGSVEKNIPSTQLYPIHHLDDKEFFPGDFIVDQKDDEPRIYGVVQSVDHQGRTANINYFKTYTSTQCPQPIFIDKREVSVYDLKDHPDFQYRPGTLVIKIANFQDNNSCTAGQVLDNYPEGRVKVWWVDGYITMCWPQDLYKVGEYDSDDGELWDDNSSNESWETEIEDNLVADNDICEHSDNIKPKLSAHIEKARIAMSRLEEIFTQNPSLQTTDVMRRLLEVYKDCRYMDKLMGTSFFHESNFQGLLERVRERGRANVAQRITDQVTRLFNHHSENPESVKNLIGHASKQDPNNTSIEKIDGVIEKITLKVNNTDEGSSNENSKTITIKPQDDEKKNLPTKSEDNTGDLNNKNDEESDNCSSNISKKESLSYNNSNSEIHLPEPDLPTNCEKSNDLSKNNDSIGNSHMCVKLCTLIKAQLLLAHAEVSKRFGLGKIAFSDDLFQTTTPIQILTPKFESDCNNIRSDDTNSNIDENVVDISLQVYSDGEGFTIDECAPDCHKFKLTMFQPVDPSNFFRTVSKEIKLLQNSLPPGVWVKGFEDRIDLYSIMFRGPEKTPYEDGLLLFDFQLSADYPSAPPLCHYISYCDDRLNPNLYEDGKVCVSLLGTWAGRGTELWTSESTLLQVIVSIQGLILVPEPYFNEAGFDKQKESQQGKENSRMYNEMVLLKLIQAQTKLIQNPPIIFENDIIKHFKKYSLRLLKKLELWMEISERHNNHHLLSPTFKNTSKIDEKIIPQFPLFPASRGFCISLCKTLATFKQALITENIISDINLDTNLSQSENILQTLITINKLTSQEHSSNSSDTKEDESS